MDGPGMLKLATLLAGEMGKEDWDHTRPWDRHRQQSSRASFEPEPVIWHSSHQEWPFLTFCKNHDRGRSGLRLWRHGGDSAVVGRRVC